MFKIFGKVKNFYKLKLSYRQDSKNIEKLTRWSVLFIIVLDIFVYSSIQMGIHFQTSTLNNPNTKFTYQCRNTIQTSAHVKDFNWHGYRHNYNTYRQNNNYIYKNGNTAASNNVIREIKHKELDSRCAGIQEKIKTIINTKKLKDIRSNIKSLERQISKYHRDLRYIQKNYNTVLFEKIANQQESDSILKMDLKAKNAKIKYDKLQKKISDTQKNIQNLKKQFSSHPLVVELYKYIRANKDGIKNDYEKSNNRYFLKRVGIMVLFLLPIALFFYWKMNVQNAKRNYTKYIIYKNIFVISMAFLIISTIRIIYNFIPHVFIEKVLMFFYNIQIPFIAYYLLLALGIVVFSFIIIRIQSFNKNKKKTTITFIESYKFNKCDKCGVKVDYMKMNYCPNCNNVLKIKCPQCGVFTIAKLDYCFNCKEKIN